MVGTELGVSSWFTVDQERINQFAACTDDQQWIHVDVKRARDDSPFGTTIAHGFLTLSMLAPTATEVWINSLKTTTLNYGIEQVRFINPVKAGARIRNRIKLLAVDERPNGILVTTGTRWKSRAKKSQPSLQQCSPWSPRIGALS